MKESLPSIMVSRVNYAKRASEVRKETRNAPQISKKVRRIIEEVRRGGDRALLDYAREFEGTKLRPGEIRVAQRGIETAAKRVSPELMSALRASYRRLRVVQSRILRGVFHSIELKGFSISVKPAPIESVGCYIPGGKAAYPSTVLMTAGLARLAGAKRVVMCTPPGGDGRVSDGVLAAAKLAGVDEVYRVGGAQAIAALAYGTESIRRVDRIVGPGGIYVSMAKRIVAADVQIDFFAGPTELVVIADKSCAPRLVAWDLVAQAEHGEDSLCGLVAFSEDYARAVRAEVDRILPRIDRRSYVERSLGRGFSAICEDRRTASRFINSLSPEHVEILTRDSGRMEASIHNAGLKLIGEFSPCAASDYCVGSDHVIPTGGFAAQRGSLSVLDFVKLQWSVFGSKEGLRDILAPLREMSSAEGLPNHYLSVESRFER